MRAARYTGGALPIEHLLAHPSSETAPRSRVSRAGVSPTFEAALREHYAALVTVATRLARDSADAHDLVQDTVERALRGFESLRPDSNVRAWLFTILRNAFLDRCRKRSALGTPESIDEQEIAAEPPEEMEEPPAWTSVTAEQLREAIGKLGEEFRAVYTLHAIEGASYLEIAERLGIPPRTVGTRLLRARRKLRDTLTTMVDGGAE